MRQTRRLALLMTALAALLPASAWAAEPPPAQHVAVPAYFYPGPEWAKMDAAAPVVGFAIANPSSGPGAAADATYAGQIKAAQAHGLRVFGYVHTSYGKRDIAQVKSEIQEYADWYHLDGIFLDEVASGADELPYYQACADAIHAAGARQLIVINPGTTCDPGYLAVSDIICTWETGAAEYLTKYQAPTWAGTVPRSRVWHIVLNVPPAQLARVLALTKQRGAGWVYVTPLGANNSDPYGKLPPTAYWSAELHTAAR